MTNKMNVLKYGLLFAILQFLSLPSVFAQNESTASDAPVPPPRLIRFTAIVQNVKGSVEKVESNKQRIPLAFQSALYEGDRFVVRSGSVVKLVTNKGCTVVYYDESQALVPNQEKPWQIRATALRWICQEQGDSFLYRGLPIKIAPMSEVLVDGARAMALTGQVQLESTPLKPRTLYSRKGKEWKEIEPELEETELWNFNQKRKPPKESQYWQKPKTPDREIESRVILSVGGGAAKIKHPNNSRSSSDNLDVFTGRFQSQHKAGKGDFIVLLMFRESEESGQKGNSGQRSLGVHNKDNLFALEAGWRFWHDSWWSPYARAGLHYQKLKAEVARQDISYFDYFAYEYYGVNASGGVDSLFYFKSWPYVGLYGAVEIQLTQALTKGGAIRESGSSSTTPPSEADNAHGLVFTSAFYLTLGLALQF